jgi:ribonuclease HI
MSANAGLLVTIYCDGACVGNPGPGGWAALLSRGGKERVISGRALNTTNNQMELAAAMKALASLRDPAAPAVIWTDSAYVVKGMTEWLPAWKANGWRTSQRKPVSNRPLWEELDGLAGLRPVTFRWLKGHAGYPENERVDALANAEAARAAVESGWKPAARFGFA